MTSPCDISTSPCDNIASPTDFFLLPKYIRAEDAQKMIEHSMSNELIHSITGLPMERIAELRKQVEKVIDIFPFAECFSVLYLI